MAKLKAGTTIDGRDVLAELDAIDVSGIIEDEGTAPEYEGVKYRLVVLNGEAFLEVVEV